jgi:hypothetical protein
MVAASAPEAEAAAQDWLNTARAKTPARTPMADLLLQAWWCLLENKSFSEGTPLEADRQAGWRAAVNGRVVELGWLARKSHRPARYESLTLGHLGL